MQKKMLTFTSAIFMTFILSVFLGCENDLTKSENDLKIEVNVPKEKTNRSVTVTAIIKGSASIEKAVCKQISDVDAETLLADDSAILATVDSLDEKKCTFEISALNESSNGVYTIAAIDSRGLVGIKNFDISNFDFTPPSTVRNTDDKYSSEKNSITLKWKNPSDKDFDHVEICYITNDGSTVSEKSEPVSTTKSRATISNIDSDKAYYRFYISTVDKLGNKSNELSCKVGVNSVIQCPVPEGFVEIPGGTIVGKSNAGKNFNGVFVKGRTVTLSDFYMCKWEVTREEYKNVIQGEKVTVDGVEYELCAEPSSYIPNPDYDHDDESIYPPPYDPTEPTWDGSEVDPNAGNYDNREKSQMCKEQGKYPVECVSWFDAVYYCNVRSLKEGFTPAYSIKIKSMWTVEKGSVEDVTKIVKILHILDADVKFIQGTDGYRLPTEAEWEYAARGGDPSKPDWDYLFSGAKCAFDRTYTAGDNSGMDTVGWYGYNNDVPYNGWVDTERPRLGPHETCKKAPNRLGLYDMSGNVTEWCWDKFYDQYYEREMPNETVTDPTGSDFGGMRVLRGGSFATDATESSVCAYNMNRPGGMSSDWGFRVVRSVR